jgi:hypothetical protein
MHHKIAFTHSHTLAQKLASRAHTIGDTRTTHWHSRTVTLTLISFHTHTIKEMYIYPTHSHTPSPSLSSTFALTFISIFSNTLSTHKALSHKLTLALLLRREREYPPLRRYVYKHAPTPVCTRYIWVPGVPKMDLCVKSQSKILSGLTEEHILSSLPRGA